MSERLARAAWSGLAEPGDPLAGALVATFGAEASLELVARVSRGEGAVPVPGLGTQHRVRLDRALQGWAGRWDPDAARRHLDWLGGLGGRLVVPDDAEWPAAVDDLGAARPMCLWVRGRDLGALLSRAAAVVGARAATAYGEHVTAGLVAGLADAEVAVVSGGAFGIDAVAHRAALAADGATVAVLAGGLDRPYPAGNARLLGAVADQGCLVAEVPPGSAPTRHRFLLRNRLIAAAGAVTVVVEAAWRSGALSTAGHAAELMRPVGAVPGPVTSATSAGCHRLLREGAVCVTDAAEVLELLDGTPAAVRVARGPTDGLGPHARIVYDALPPRGDAAPTALTRACGLALADVLAALGTLELAGCAAQRAGRWRRV